MADDRRIDPDVKLLLGFMVGTITIGVVVYLLIKALRETLSGLGSGPNGQPINIYNVTGGQGVALPAPVQAIQPSAIANRMELGDGTSLATKTDTVSLSTLFNSRVFGAPRTGPTWMVRLHVLGPAGAFAAFAVDGSPNASGGNSMVVPAGGHTMMRVGPRQTISAIATGQSVEVSYVAQAEVV